MMMMILMRNKAFLDHLAMPEYSTYCTLRSTYTHELISFQIILTNGINAEMSLTELQSSGWLKEEHSFLTLVDIKAGAWLWPCSRCHEGPLGNVPLVPLLLRSSTS